MSLLAETPAGENPQTTPQAETKEPIINPNPDVNWTTAIDEQGNFNDTAHGYGLPDHIKSVGGMLKSYQEMQRMKGSPGSEATPEQIKAFREAQGVPEVANAETYGFTVPDELKEIYSGESLDRIAKAANDNAHLGHKGMLQAVFQEFSTMEVEGLNANQEASEQDQKAALEQRVKQLEEDPSFTGAARSGSLQTATNALNSALGALGVSSDSPEAQEVANSPLMVRILRHFGSKTSQDNMNLGNANSDLRSQQDIAMDIMTNPAHPEHQAYLDGNPTVSKKVLSYMGA